jgi:hypothetical protein
MRYLRLSLLLAVGFGLGCDSSAPAPPVPPGWQAIDAAGAFTFKAPADLKPVPIQGIDSFVGHYVSPTLDVTFDYGRYSDPMKGEGYASRSVQVDGKSARLVTQGDVVAIHFPKVAGDTRLTMRVRLNGADAKTAETLLRSIHFP